MISRNYKSVLDKDELRAYAPSVFATESYAETSGRYTFIPTSRVVGQLADAGWNPVAAKEQRVILPERRGFQKHVVRFQNQRFMGSNEARPEIILTNSHDAKSAYIMTAGIFRLVCLNGLMVGSKFEEVRIRHVGYQDQHVWSAAHAIEKLIPVMMDKVEAWKGAIVPNEFALVYAAEALNMRWPVTKEGATAPFTPSDLLRRRRYTDETTTLWGLYNVVQETLISGRQRTWQSRSIRAINSIDQDIRLNRQLWDLTDQLGKSVAAH